MTMVPASSSVELRVPDVPRAGRALASLRAMLSAGIARVGGQATALVTDTAGEVPRPAVERPLPRPRSASASSRPLRQSSSPMKVADVMTTRVVLVPPEASVQEAATIMAEHDIGAVLVGEPERLAGVLTDRDVLLRVVVDGRDPKTVRVAEVMSKEIFGCRAEDTLEDVFREMGERQVRRLPVLDEDGQLLGIVVMSDLATRGDSGRTLDQMRAISEPHRRAAAEAAPEPKSQPEPSQPE